jgi:hypothetical protein
MKRQRQDKPQFDQELEIFTEGKSWRLNTGKFGRFLGPTRYPHVLYMQSKSTRNPKKTFKACNWPSSIWIVKRTKRAGKGNGETL